MTLHFLNAVASDAESTQKKSKNSVKIARLKSESVGKLINKIHALSKSCLVNLMSTRTHLVFSIYNVA